MKHGSLFSGIGGFDLAAEWMGWENVFHCEWNEFGQKVLKHHFPKAISYHDITKTDFTIHRGQVNVLSGGFPCQPFSTAGKRKGQDDERYLWHEMLRAVQEIEPTYVIAENVFGITNIDGGLVFEQVCADLESEGYEVQPFIIPAAAKNAPHRRDRVWFVAYRTSERLERSAGESIQGRSVRLAECSNKNATDTRCERFKQCRIPGQISKTERISGTERSKFRIPFKTMGNGLESNWQDFPTQSPICSGDDGLPTELDGITFSKWRAESIKGYGNAIVPQVAYEIFKAMTL